VQPAPGGHIGVDHAAKSVALARNRGCGAPIGYGGHVDAPERLFRFGEIDHGKRAVEKVLELFSPLRQHKIDLEIVEQIKCGARPGRLEFGGELLIDFGELVFAGDLLDVGAQLGVPKHAGLGAAAKFFGRLGDRARGQQLADRRQSALRAILCAALRAALRAILRATLCAALRAALRAILRAILCAILCAALRAILRAILCAALRAALRAILRAILCAILCAALRAILRAASRRNEISNEPHKFGRSARPAGRVPAIAIGSADGIEPPGDGADCLCSHMKAIVGGREYALGGWAQSEADRRAAEQETYPGRTYVTAAEITGGLAAAAPEDAMKRAAEKYMVAIGQVAAAAGRRNVTLNLSRDWAAADLFRPDHLRALAAEAAEAAAAAGSQLEPPIALELAALGGAPARAKTAATDDPEALRALERSCVPAAERLENLRAVCAEHVDRAASAISAWCAN